MRSPRYLFPVLYIQINPLLLLQHVYYIFISCSRGSWVYSHEQVVWMGGGNQGREAAGRLQTYCGHVPKWSPLHANGPIPRQRGQVCAGHSFPPPPPEAQYSLKVFASILGVQCEWRHHWVRDQVWHLLGYALIRRNGPYYSIVNEYLSGVGEIYSSYWKTYL